MFSKLSQQLTTLSLALIAVALGGFEWVQIVNLLSDFTGSVEMTGVYLDMELAPSADQWRALEFRGSAKIAVAAACAVHLLAGLSLASGAALMLNSAHRQQAIELIVLGLLIGLAFQVVSFVFVGSWLRISTTTAATHAALYGILAILFGSLSKKGVE